MPQSGSDIVLIAATASGRVMRRGVTHFSGGRRVTGGDWSKGLRSAGFVPWSLSLAFVWSRMLAPQACEIWRRRRACQAESTPRSFLHAYLCARKAAVMATLISLYGMWMRWVNFFLQIIRLCWDYIDYMSRQLNYWTCGGAHDSDAAGRRRLGMSHSCSCCQHRQPDQQRESSVPTA